MSERSSDWVTRVTPERVAEAEARVRADMRDENLALGNA